MLILDTFSSIENGKFRVEDFHRGHLSLKSGTALNIVALPGHHLLPVPKLTEIIITPIKFESWEKLTRINARVRNRPGILRKVMLALAHANINILYHASGPLKNGKLQRIEFLVDASSFYRRFDTVHCDRKMKDYHVLSQLEIWLKSLLIQDLDFDDKRARIKVRPMEMLRATWRAYHKFNRESSMPTPIWEKTTIDKGVIDISCVLNKLEYSPKDIMLNSDTKDRLLKGLLFQPADHSTYLRVTYNNNPGSTATICSLLADYFYFVFSLTRIQNTDDTRVLELMLYSQDMPTSAYEDKRRLVIEALLSDDKCKNFGVSISYPLSLSGADPSPREPSANRDILIPMPLIQSLCPDERQLLTKSAAEILRYRLDSTRNISDSNLHTSQDQFASQLSHRHHIEACLELLARLGDEDQSHSKIFVSFPFDYEDLFQVVKSKFENKGFIVITGQRPNSSGQTPFRDVIVDRIISCSGFFGIWKYTTKTGAAKFSPWLLWELGIAQSCKMPVRICPHEGMKSNKFMPQQLILPERHMEHFSDSGFSDYVDGLIDDFVQDVRVFARSRLNNGPNLYSHTN
jgi:hypothetical protein